jgi:hypothetical protein
MSQKHVDLLMEAVALEDYDRYLCNRIGCITGHFGIFPEYNENYNEEDYQILTQSIQKNINENLGECFLDEGEDQTYESTTFYEQGMTREQWAKEILAPLALEIEEG